MVSPLTTAWFDTLVIMTGAHLAHKPSKSIWDLQMVQELQMLQELQLPSCSNY